MGVGFKTLWWSVFHSLSLRKLGSLFSACGHGSPSESVFHGLGLIYLRGLGSVSEVLELLESLSKFCSEVFSVWGQSGRSLNSLSNCAPKFDFEVCGVCIQGVWSLKSFRVCVSRYKSEVFRSLCSGPPISELLRLCQGSGIWMFVFMVWSLWITKSLCHKVWVWGICESLFKVWGLWNFRWSVFKVWVWGIWGLLSERFLNSWRLSSKVWIWYIWGFCSRCEVTEL